MLTDRPLVAFVPVTDPEAARAFYVDTLGMTLLFETPFAVELDAGGTRLKLAVSPQGVVNQTGTPVGWIVDDVGAAVEQLAGRGVELLRFPGLEQDERGVWTAPGAGVQVAWFADPFGNTLSVSSG